MRRLVLIALIQVLAVEILGAQETPARSRSANPHVALMQAVFRITGLGDNARETITGTGFLVERTSPLAAGTSEYVAVTAAHVLRRISGDNATFRIPMTRPDGTHQSVVLPMTIRRKGAQLWTELPGADVAVISVPLPATGVKTISFDRLATDEDVEQVLLLSAGDVVHVLTHPFGYEFNDFPVVRSVTLASHPLVPARTVKRLVVDFTAFGGDSGGPVYSGPRGAGAAWLEEDVRILGMVTQQVLSPDRTQNTGLTFVTPAAFIREAISLLPQRMAPAQ